MVVYLLLSKNTGEEIAAERAINSSHPKNLFGSNQQRNQPTFGRFPKKQTIGCHFPHDGKHCLTTNSF
jgi:hypothetical protein